MKASTTSSPLSSRIAWCSDLHLEHLSTDRLVAFKDALQTSSADMIVITGDTCSSWRIGEKFKDLASLGKPVYFTTGNHEFYGSSFSAINSILAAACLATPGLTRLGFGEVIPLSSKSVLIGHGGWGDGRAGVGEVSNYHTDDQYLIAELAGITHGQMFQKLRELGDRSARYISDILPLAFKVADHVFIATHVPPFEGASIYRNAPSSPEAAPHFVNKALGRVLLKAARDNPAKAIVVLCGHTHTAAQYQPATNLLVKVASAIYGEPGIYEVIETMC